MGAPYVWSFKDLLLNPPPFPADFMPVVRVRLSRADVAFGSSATGAGQQRVRPCPLCPISRRIVAASDAILRRYGPLE